MKKFSRNKETNNDTFLEQPVMYDKNGNMIINELKNSFNAMKS